MTDQITSDPAPKKRRHRTPKPPPVAPGVLEGLASDESFALELGRHPRTVRTWFDSAGIAVHWIGATRYRRIADVRALIETGAAPNEAAPKKHHRAR